MRCLSVSDLVQLTAHRCSSPLFLLLFLLVCFSPVLRFQDRASSPPAVRTTSSNPFSLYTVHSDGLTPSLKSRDPSSSLSPSPSSSPLSPYLITDPTQLPSLQPDCHGPPRVLRPHTFDWPDHPGLGLVMEAWFSTPLDLVLVTFMHPDEPPYASLQVVVDGWQNVTGHYNEVIEDLFVREKSTDHNLRHFTFYLTTPVNASNSVAVSILGRTVVWTDLIIQTELAVSTDVVHVTLFKYDVELLQSSYDHYTQQGFTRFVWAYNGEVTAEVLASMPQRCNIVLVEWNYTYMIRDAQQQCLFPLLTWSMLRLLPQVDWLMYTDMDEYAHVTTGMPIMQRIASLPQQQLWTFRNRFAHVQDGWKEWMADYANGSTTTPLIIRPDTGLLECIVRSKTLYHRSFPKLMLPIIGPHTPLHPIKDYCHPELEHYHVLNYRRVTTQHTNTHTLQQQQRTVTPPAPQRPDSPHFCSLSCVPA